MSLLQVYERFPMSPIFFCRLVLVAILGLAAEPAVSVDPPPHPPPLRAGFPLQISNGGGILSGHPAVADLGLTPGHKSIIFGTFEFPLSDTSLGKLFVVTTDGTNPPQVAPGFPVLFPQGIASSPAIGDLGDPTGPVIVVGFGSTFQPHPHPPPDFSCPTGGLWAVRNDGSTKWRFTTTDTQCLDGKPDAVQSSAAIGDVDGDGFNEVAFGSFDNYIHLLDGRTGTEKPGWPIFVKDTIWSTPALHDIDGDGKPDVVIGTDFGLPGGSIHAYRYDGNPVPGFPVYFDQVIQSSPAIGDIDGDGRPEIVFGTGTFYPNRLHRVYALKCDGSMAPGWPVTVDGEVSTAPALADINGDGKLEVIVTDRQDLGGGQFAYHVYAFAGNGTLLWKTVPKSFGGQSLSAGDPIAANVYGDAKPEVLLSTNTEVCVIDGTTGSQLTDDGRHIPDPGNTYPPNSFTYLTANGIQGAVVDDFEGDGLKAGVVAVSTTPFGLNSPTTEVYVWNPKGIPGSTPPWGAFHQGPDRRGVVPLSPSCASSALRFFTLPPCRLLDTRNPVGPFGGPSLPGGGTRTFNLAGRCGVPVDARSISVNVTVVAPAVVGFLTLYPAGSILPLVSTINFGAGQVRANNAIIRLTSDGLGGLAITNGSGGPAHAVVDVNGFFR